MKKFTVITKDGSKWLRPVNPHEKHLVDEFGLFRNPDHVTYELQSRDTPYIGSRPEGTTLDESEVVSVVQYDVNGRWISNEELYRMGFKFRIAYTDAESHDRYISDDCWRKRCESAEKLIGISPSDPKTYDEFCRLREDWKQIVKQEPK